MIEIYGSSDDLIEIDGDIREEFNAEEGYLAFSDGTVLYIEYGKEGIWRIRQMTKGKAKYTKTEGIDDDNYSDKVTLDGDISWVVFGKEFVNII